MLGGSAKPPDEASEIMAVSMRMVVPKKWTSDSCRVLVVVIIVVCFPGLMDSVDCVGMQERRWRN